MEIILISIGLIAAILLILVVIIQPGKADMISGMGGFGGQMTNLLGVRQSRNVLQNATMVLLGVIILISISVNKFFLSTDEGGTGRVPVSQGVEIPQTPVAQPSAPAPQGK
jgi:protein translocase SecG subunit